MTHEEIDHAQIALAIHERLLSTNVGETLRSEGISTVALDDEGNMVRHLPDGISAPLAPGTP